MGILLQFLHMVKQGAGRHIQWLEFKISLASKYFNRTRLMVLSPEPLKIYGTFIII